MRVVIADHVILDQILLYLKIIVGSLEKILLFRQKKKPQKKQKPNKKPKTKIKKTKTKKNPSISGVHVPRPHILPWPQKAVVISVAVTQG